LVLFFSLVYLLAAFSFSLLSQYLFKFLILIGGSAPYPCGGAGYYGSQQQPQQKYFGNAYNAPAQNPPNMPGNYSAPYGSDSFGK
jgi:hypothetical protein